MQKGALAILVALLAGWASVPLARAAWSQSDSSVEAAPPRIYKWVDENGIAHYTTDRERIPGSLRRRIGRLGDEPALEREAFETGGPSDEFDDWARRDRSSPRRDVWDEALDEGDAYQPPPSSEELVLVEAERLDIERRIDALETEIAADENALKAMISDPEVEPLERGDDPEFRAIAMRIPKQLAKLRALRVRRDELDQDAQPGQP